MERTEQRRSFFDWVLVVTYAAFAFNSLVMEWYAILAVDLLQRPSWDILGRAWGWYARSFDPLFLNPPLYLRIMCAFDTFFLGPAFVFSAFALYTKRNLFTTPRLLRRLIGPAFSFKGVARASSLVLLYSVALYFLVEFIGERGRANLLVVTIVNGAYFVFPILLMRRVRNAPTNSGR